MRKRSGLFEAFIKYTQKVSELDSFLETFKETYVFQTYEEMEDGLSVFDSIPYDKAYIFPFTT